MDDGHASVSNASPENDDSVFEPAILPGSSGTVECHAVDTGTIKK